MDNNEFEGPTLKLSDENPQAFVLGQAYLVRDYTFRYLSTKGDVLGGLSSNQYGLVAIQAREALEQGVRIYIGWRIALTRQGATLTAMLAEACGVGHQAIADQGIQLLLASPTSDQEVIAYANECFDYIEQALGLKPPLTSMGHGSKEERAVYDADSLEIARLASHLGLTSPYTGSRFDEYLKEEAGF